MTFGGSRPASPEREKTMKIASSSIAFARAFVAREMTQLEWLDIAANELEVDAVVFSGEHFARTDAEHCAQLKKVATDLGLVIAAIDARDLLDDGGESWLDVATLTGAPLAIVRAPAVSDDPSAWSAFVERLKVRAKGAKRANVTLALRNVPGTIIASVDDARRVAKDVDSAWLRFEIDVSAARGFGDATSHLDDAVIAAYRIASIARFATDADDEALALIGALKRFRGCVVLEAGEVSERAAYHDALARFATLRARALAPAV